MRALPGADAAARSSLRASAPSETRRPTVDGALTLGACAGAAAATAVVWLYALADPTTSRLTWPDVLLVTLLGSVPEFTFRPAFLVARHGTVLLAGLALVLVWRRSRAVALTGARVAVFAAAAWVAAMACATAYALDHAAGLLPAIVAAPFAAGLPRWRRWRNGIAVVLAGGCALGALCAQSFFTFPFQDDFKDFVSPVWGIVPPVVLALIGATWLTFGRTPRPAGAPRPSAAQLWAMLTCSLASAVLVAAELRGVRVRPPEPAGSRVVGDWGYDVHVTGEPPQLVWTDRKRINVMADPYGARADRYTVDDDMAYYVERIWPSPTGGFYMQGIDKLEWWPAPVDARLAYRPAWRWDLPPSLRADSSTTWTIAEDPPTGRLFTVGEYFSRYVVIDRATSAPVADGTFSRAVWPFWSFTTDVPNRVLYVTSGLDDGGLYRMSLDTLALTRTASSLYLYETVLDPERQLLWGVRPLTGEVVAVDTATNELRHRVAVEFGLRDLQRDRSSGDLYTCSEFFGDVFRIDGTTHAVSRIGWCGRLCRDMYLDEPRHTLWVATRDGICRLDAHRAAIGRQE